MTPSLDTSLLRTFVTVAEVHHFTRAGKLLGLSQSAVSLQIRKLEELVGVALLGRDSRGVTLTAAGHAFLGHARRILSTQAEAIASIRALEREARVRIGLPDVYAVQFLPEVLAAFRPDHPGVHPEVTCDVSTELLRRFDDGALDVCLAVRHDPGSQGEVLGHEPLAWVAGEPLALAVEEPVPLALYPEPCVFRAFGLRALGKVSRPWRIVYTSQSSAAIDIAIDHGHAVAIKGRSTVKPSWRQLGEADGFPPLEPVQIELHAAPGLGDAGAELAARLRSLVREALAGR
jgi:DNA-binding transcriptional LysR family regulator